MKPSRNCHRFNGSTFSIPRPGRPLQSIKRWRLIRDEQQPEIHILRSALASALLVLFLARPALFRLWPVLAGGSFHFYCSPGIPT